MQQPRPYRYIPLVLEGGSTHRATQQTAELLQEVGRPAAIRRMTNLFYSKAFRDPALDKFIADHADPHGMRLANWIVEKMGGGTPWTQERVERSKCPVTRLLSNGRHHTVHDRSSAHAAAWWSPKRPDHEAGRHFQVHDCRVWMRLMFWSAREVGLFDASPTFADWYVRFIAHFVAVYEQRAPPFARESARWSADAANVRAYEANGFSMGPEVLGRDGQGVDVRQAMKGLPAEEADPRSEWPYAQ